MIGERHCRTLHANDAATNGQSETHENTHHCVRHVGLFRSIPSTDDSANASRGKVRSPMTWSRRSIIKANWFSPMNAFAGNLIA